MVAESGKHSGSMSAFVPFFISSATFSYVSTGNLDLLILICVVPQHPSLYFLSQPRDRSTSPHPSQSTMLYSSFHTIDSKSWFKRGRKWESCGMNLGLGSKRKRGKVVDTGYPTGLLVEKAKKAWWMAKGGEKWTCLFLV